MTTLNIRIDEKLKTDANKTFSKLGLDMSSAVKMFLHQVVTENGLPFQPTAQSKFRINLDSEIEDALSGEGYRSAENMHRAILGKKVYDNWE